MQIKEIVALIDKLDTKLATLLCHHNADPDALCAALAFSRLLKNLRPEVEIEIGAAQGASKLGKHVFKALHGNLKKQPRIEEADIIILLDTNNVQQLSDWCERVVESDSPLVVIDHHPSHPETERIAMIYIADEEASSACEVVYGLFKEARIELSEVEAKAIFLGIAFDTRHFAFATSKTFKVLADLIDAGVNAQETLSLLSLPKARSERIARLKASRRAKLVRVNDWLIALSNISSYQASAARALIRLGYHVAIVAGQRRGKVQISLRSSLEFYEKTGIHLGRDIAKQLGEYLRGMGGGHSVSAGVNGVGNSEASLKRGLLLLKEALD